MAVMHRLFVYVRVGACVCVCILVVCVCVRLLNIDLPATRKCIKFKLQSVAQ